MKTLIYLSALSFAVACKTADKGPAAEVAPTEKPAIERPQDVGPGTEHAEHDLDACLAECMQANAMRSVAAEVIEADCKAGCTGEPETLGTQSLD